MPALVAGIHALTVLRSSERVDGRDKPGHDGGAGHALTIVRAACRRAVTNPPTCAIGAAHSGELFLTISP
jgi:hypothetical protein